VLGCVALSLAGCGGGGSGDTSSSSSAASTVSSYYALSGVAQKGPLLKGSTVCAQELDAGLQPTGNTYLYQVNSDLGTFSPTAVFASPYIELSASGYYYDEVTGAPSSAKISLNGFADLTSSRVLNVNLLTTLVYLREKNLVIKEHMTLAVARQQAEHEVLTALHEPAVSLNGGFEALDISHNGDGDKLLAAVSSLFVNSAPAGGVNALISSFQSDIADNGIIDNPATTLALATSAQTLDAGKVAKNLNVMYAVYGFNDSAVDVSKWINSQADAVIGKSVSAVKLPLQLLAGSVGGPGNADGAGPAARFNAPGQLAVDGSGTVYVADTGNNTIRKISPTGVTSTLAGYAGQAGSADGDGPAARFNAPVGVAADIMGNVYVADAGNSTIRKITPAGVVTTIAGLPHTPGSSDGVGVAARFSHATGIAVDTSSNLFVADTGNNTIRKIDQNGQVTTLAGTAQVWGRLDGTGAAASFSSPAAVGLAASGDVYVADAGNNMIRKVTAAGVVTTFAGSARGYGNTDGMGWSARFYYPSGIALDSSGTVYVADTANGMVRRITPAGLVTTLTTADAGGSPQSALSLAYPAGVALDAAGNIYVSETGDNRIRRISPDNIATDLAGTGTIGANDGRSDAARFHCPHGLAADAEGNVYVADSENNAVRKIDGGGVVSTLAGGKGSSLLNSPSGLAVDGVGNVYVADSGNNVIRKISPNGAISLLAGNPQYGGHADGRGTDAQFFFPRGVAVDNAGNVYVADTYNNIIRKISADGVVSTLAGSAGQAGYVDGVGTAARFNDPSGIAVDANGIVYVSDTDNGTIRMIGRDGRVSTLAGNAGRRGDADGEESDASFYYPVGIAVSSDGTLYVADAFNDTVRKISSMGMVSTVVGKSGQPGYSLGALPGLIFVPLGVAALPQGGLVFDSNNAILTVSGV
jgi:sugar lactone lactonase YvrE